VSGTQALVGAAGVGLIAANAWTGQQRGQLAAVLGPDGAPGGTNTTQAHAAAKAIGAELLGVLVLVLVAGVGDGAGHACLAILAALWIVYLLNRTPSTHGATGAVRLLN